MKHHMKIMHDQRKDYKCELCEKTFTELPKMHIHQKAIHDLKDEAFECVICFKKYLSENKLKIHIKRFHDKHDKN